MFSNKKIVTLIIFFLLTAGFFGAFIIEPMFNGPAGDIEPSPQDKGSNNTFGEISKEVFTGGNSDWEEVLSSNETFSDGGSGHGSDILKFTVDDIHLLKIQMRIISELCSSCGGIGKGEVTVAIVMPSGELAYQNVFTESSDLNILQTYPQEGEWQIIIDGVAVGEDYIIGYSAKVLTIGNVDE